MKLILFLGISFLLSSCGVQHHFATSEEAEADTTYIYALPYPKGTSHLLIQGYNSKFSHRGRLGLDFKMKRGSPVTAARSGTVVNVQEGATKGGLKSKYLHNGNYVIIRHSDGSQAYYGHLQQNGVLVNIGDRVEQGQVIAKSGSTGYSAFPHLHFITWGQGRSGGRSQLPTRFNTRKGAKYLRPGRWYKSL
jgi:murein DD-endopeptidase MepM/ murein hydrolase activator NlpD